MKFLVNFIIVSKKENILITEAVCMIEFKAVSKTYNGTVKALDNMNFTVGDGELVGFIGPNGSGKTTTIKLLSGVLTPDKGTITVNGFDVGREPLKAKASIGYIADNPNIDFERCDGKVFSYYEVNTANMNATNNT